ncbi:MAG: hypothetical protein HY280_08370 [Nitrospinae bacterium]|nr:hypothetical protein [Nitrospinota bacterium]
MFLALAVVLFSSFNGSVFADDKNTESQATIQLREKGFLACGFAVENLAKFFFDGDFDYLNTWNVNDAANHTAVVTGTKNYADGNIMVTISVTETKAGTCDTSFVALYPSYKTCAQVRETTFKDWKFYSDVLSGVPVYEDPSNSAVAVALEQLKGGCMAIKSGLIFFTKPEPPREIRKVPVEMEPPSDYEVR